MKIEELNKMDACRHLLPEPGSEVAGKLITEVRRLQQVITTHADLFDQRAERCEKLESSSIGADSVFYEGSAHVYRVVALALRSSL